MLIVLTLVGGYLIFYFYPQDVEQFTFCPLKFTLDIPCPACGSIRATSLFLKGDLLGGFMVNPLTLLTHSALLVGCVWAMVDLFRGSDTLIPALRKKWNPYVLYALLILLLINMVWNYIKGL